MANYQPYEIVVLSNGRGTPREVPKFCAAARVHAIPSGNGTVEYHPAPHDFSPTYNDVDGPGALCASCLLYLRPNDLKPFHEAYYEWEPGGSS